MKEILGERIEIHIRNKKNSNAISCSFVSIVPYKIKCTLHLIFIPIFLFFQLMFLFSIFFPLCTENLTHYLLYLFFLILS